MKKTRVWFNHWFSQAYRLIEQLKSVENGRFEVIGTNDKETCVYKTVCDAFYVEPIIKEEQGYIDWCIEFCKAEEIAVFIPRRNRTIIAKHIARFEDIGVKVLVHNDAWLMEILENKADTAKLFESFDICKVPYIEVAHDLESFKQGYRKVKGYVGDMGKVCVKYSVGEGGLSFRVIDDSIDGIESLNTWGNNKISYAKLKALIKGAGQIDELMIMPYMQGVELSLDSLMTTEGFIGVIRAKTGGRLKEISIDKDILAISERFAEVTGITCPYNLQLRWYRGEWHLLEVNTRMAGGTYMSESLGVNFPYLAVKELIGEKVEMPKVTAKRVKVSQIETMIKLEEESV